MNSGLGRLLGSIALFVGSFIGSKMETARALTLDTMIFSAPYGFGWQTNVFD